MLLAYWRGGFHLFAQTVCEYLLLFAFGLLKNGHFCYEGDTSFLKCIKCRFLGFVYELCHHGHFFLSCGLMIKEGYLFIASYRLLW